MSQDSEAQAGETFVLAGATIAPEDLGGILMAVLVDNADGILIVDAEGEIVAANPAAEQLFGREVSDLVGSPLGVPITTGVHVEIELLVPGGLRYAELLSRTTTWHGEPARVVTLRDVTARRKAIDSLRDYVSMTAHEVATPMTSITGFAETLDDQWDRLDDDRKRQFIEVIRRQSSRVSAISQDLLTLSRIDAARMENHPEPVRVRDVVEVLLDAHGDDEPPIEVDVARDLVVSADPAHVETILGNFLSNAGKYGEPPFQISASLVDLDGRDAVRIEVSDCGEGVPRDFRAKLFERFARARHGIAKRKEGTGLGLSLSASLAELNDGSVGHRPNAPTGSVFHLTLPRSEDRLP